MIKHFPDESSMLLLGAETLEASPQDGFWLYRFQDGNQVELLLSFDIFEGSIQTQLKFQGKEVITVSHENTVSISVENEEKISADFDVPNQYISLEIHLIPEIKVKWSTLDV